MVSKMGREMAVENMYIEREDILGEEEKGSTGLMPSLHRLEPNI